MKRYDTYKDSGVQWLGEIPGHWERTRLKNVMKLLNGRAYLQPELQEEGKYRILRVGNFFTNDKWYYSDMELEPNKYCEKGDLLFAWSASFGPYIWDDEKVIYHYHIWKVLLGEKYDKYYAYFMFKAFSEVKRRDVHGSTMVHLTLQDMNQSYIPLPPLSEQNSIVSYLDDKCGMIDKMVEGKQKQIELLAEMKQRIIADAVTRGLNPDVKMKATNIPWLPEIPEHWDVKRAKNLFNKEQRPIEEGDDIVTCFRDGEVTLRKNRRTTGFTEATDYSHYQHICKGDLVIHQMDAFAGSSGVSDSDGMGTPVLSVCTAKTEGLNHYYYAFILRLMGKNNFILSLYRGIRERSSDFRFETFAKQYLPVPPASEQDKIVKFINERSSKIDTLTSKLQQEIESIKEYKQRLISDVVTGQIKVC